MAAQRTKSNMGTTNMLKDIEHIHDKFKVHKALSSLSDEMLREFLEFRVGCIREELEETEAAVFRKDAEEVVDGLVDILVFTLGTLDLFGVDADKAWKEVMNANINKEIGIKPGRPNPYGLPDLVKPDGWRGPSHTFNHGTIGDIFNDA